MIIEMIVMALLLILAFGSQAAASRMIPQDHGSVSMCHNVGYTPAPCPPAN
ncbi:hypothetical protein COLO4_05583 [Corchorus olitorius]|uniref:Uncharacterized protein n=1 Tax=Corchorus olitorius TaxID=93759 RepID=A0A1R3KQK3_9ROSI|nr:hypothetical protein COLO4_05583 [Corchorus olitorius]